LEQEGDGATIAAIAGEFATIEIGAFTTGVVGIERFTQLAISKFLSGKDTTLKF